MRPDDSVPVPPALRRAADLGLKLRPICDADLPFLRSLYASTRQEELAPVPWTEDEKLAFLGRQFEAQHAHYLTHYADATFSVLEKDDVPTGRLYVARWPDEHRIVDIAFMPEQRGRGCGTALISDLIEEAAWAGKQLSIHIERMNPALRLYERLGFRLVEDKGVYLLLAVGGDT